ncbi:cytochrome subunit of sulfide dehydrogenase [Malonomonas rubra DSM 5091]|uniref:Cytochrome subunit of sulfide dehydrogenase n=1 Tax=Malonomonas rubra DSM 5091 TaxID=1122189 RepID=A0A1M6CH82_MALRU|nr:c-type cytochrome [Malonomonas rubra]SHI60372.1 cytochrome subunit of sulfide dehydrogenase [Malonomonas rubra DSM 5091]
MTLQQKFLCCSIVIFSLALAGVVFAAGNQPLPGERLSKTCASCHGTDGASPGKLIPIIGGQKKGYLQTVMKEYASGVRPGSVMANLAKGYDAKEQKQIAEFFFTKPWVNTPHAAASTAKATLVKSCQGCHGKNGEGKGNFPRIGGQHPEYLLEALLEYKNGERKAGTMMLVKGIDEATLKQMADYYSSLK